MRCKCCDNPNAKWWGGDFYCQPCRNAIRDCIKETNDTHKKGIYRTIAGSTRRITINEEGETPILDSTFDDEENT